MKLTSLFGFISLLGRCSVGPWTTSLGCFTVLWQQIYCFVEKCISDLCFVTLKSSLTMKMRGNINDTVTFFRLSPSEVHEEWESKACQNPYDPYDHQHDEHSKTWKNRQQNYVNMTLNVLFLRKLEKKRPWTGIQNFKKLNSSYLILFEMTMHY